MECSHKHQFAKYSCHRFVFLHSASKRRGTTKNTRRTILSLLLKLWLRLNGQTFRIPTKSCQCGHYWRVREQTLVSKSKSKARTPSCPWGGQARALGAWRSSPLPSCFRPVTAVAGHPRVTLTGFTHPEGKVIVTQRPGHRAEPRDERGWSGKRGRTQCCPGSVGGQALFSLSEKGGRAELLPGPWVET